MAPSELCEVLSFVTLFFSEIDTFWPKRQLSREGAMHIRAVCTREEKTLERMALMRARQRQQKNLLGLRPIETSP